MNRGSGWRRFSNQYPVDVFAVGLAIARWAFAQPNQNGMETALSLVSDGFNTTCVQLDIENGAILLRGQLSLAYGTCHVTVTMATPVVFGPGRGQSACQTAPSWRMTHLGPTCNQTFCAVPATCRYFGNDAITGSSIVWHHDFTCVCGQSQCHELLLWLQADPTQGKPYMVSLCEIAVSPVWLLLLLLFWYIKIIYWPSIDLFVYKFVCRWLNTKENSLIKTSFLH